jgi:segregation and condensation protein B
LLAAGKSLQPAELVVLFDESARPQVQDIHAALTNLMEEYSNRGIEIKETAAGFRIQVRPEMANEISRLWSERPARYSRALLETLALIAYRQPITRAEIEAVRGVAVNPNILKTVIERNWVRVVGHRDVPGRPELLGTTREFLDYFGLKTLDDLPPLADLKTIGDIKVQFDLPDPGPLAEGSQVDGAAVAVGETAGDGTAAVVDGSAVIGDTTSAHAAEAAGAVGHDGVPHTDSGVPGVSHAAGAGGGSAATESETRQDDAVEDVAVLTEATVAATLEGRADGSAADGDESPAASSIDGPVEAGQDVVRRGAPESALHEAEEFAASVDAELAAGDDESSDDDELSAAGPGSSELVAGPRNMDD